MTSLQKALRPIASRRRWQRAVRLASLCAAVGGGAALLLGAAAFLWPIENALLYGALGTAILTIFGLVIGFLWPISAAQAAKCADACGLEERTQTALELQNAPRNPMRELQEADAFRALGNLSVKAAMPVKPDGRLLLVTACCLFISVALFFVPNPQKDVLQNRAAFQAEMKKQAERVEDGAAAMKPQDDPAALEAQRLLKEFARELRESRDPKEALTAVDRSAEKLEKLTRQEMDAVQQALSQSGMEALAEAMQKQDESAISEALEKADSAALQKALAEATKASASSAEAMQKAAEAMAAGNASQAAKALLDASMNAGACLSQGSALMQMAQIAAMNTGQSLGMLSAASGLQPIGALGMQGQSGGGNGNGTGAMGSGQGAGLGAGMGSTNLDAGYMSQQRSSSQSMRGTANPTDKVGIYEALYDPTRLGGSGEVTQERGIVGEGETTEMTIGGGAAGLGDMVPYSEVALEYSESAVQAVKEANLPAYAQKWVESYFQSLLD